MSATVSSSVAVPARPAESAVSAPTIEFTPFQVPGQRVVHGNAFPLALTLADKTAPVSLPDIKARIQHLAADGTIRSLLNQHGVLFFRGLPLKTPQDLSFLVDAFGFREEHQELGLSGARSSVTKYIKTASELPGTVSMHFHNEYARTNHFPEIVFFFSERVPEKGGQTPLLSSTELYDRLQVELPEFVKDLEEKQVTARQYYPSKNDPEAEAIGYNWQDSYGFDIKEGDSIEVQHAKVEKLLRDDIHATAVWQSDAYGDGLQVVQRVPAIRTIKSTGRKSFFNGLAGVYGNAKRSGSLRPPHKIQNGPGYKLPSSYGDGSDIPDAYHDRLIEIQDEIGFLVPWQEGDLAVVNNYTVQHSRTKFVGDRSVLVSLWDDIDDFVRK